MDNGTSALIASLIAHGIGPGDEVIVPTLTFISTVNSIFAVGAKPILVDSDLKTWNTTPELVAEKITKKTRAIMPVDVAGMPIDIDGFRKLAEEKNLILIEDSAEALGAEYKGKKVGSFGHTSILSFHMAKLVSTVEGGAVLTNDGKIAESLRSIRTHGMSSAVKVNYDYINYGLNFRMTDIQSAIGIEQLKKLDKTIEHRNKLVAKYKKGLGNVFSYQNVPDYVTKNPYMFFGILDEPEKRDKRIELLLKNNIDVRICWLPAHLQSYHKKLFKGKYPNAEKIGNCAINLPLGNSLTEEEVDYVIRVLQEGKIC
jgi:perosamine synthetase